MSETDAECDALLRLHAAACDYNACSVDEARVEAHLRTYLDALGEKQRQIVRLRAGWTVEEHPSLNRYVEHVLSALAKNGGVAVDRATEAREARVAREAVARVARVAREAVARAAREAMAAGEASAARAAWEAREAVEADAAVGARAARAARDARDAGDAGAAVAAGAATEARTARAAEKAMSAVEAREAVEADAAVGARAVRDARDAGGAGAAVAVAALAAVAGAATEARTAEKATEMRTKLAAWCIQSGEWLWWRWDLSWITTVFIGARQLGGFPTVERWAQPLFEAFVAGAWTLHWTDDTLYWVGKPKIHYDDNRQLHRDNGPALESDVEPLYFWHGTNVPAFVILRPDLITREDIHTEENVEVRRVMLERFGFDRYLAESGAQLIHRDPYGHLYRAELPDDEPLTMVRVRNSTPEPDGHYKEYAIRVPPDVTTARAAVAWTFGLQEHEYCPATET